MQKGSAVPPPQCLDGGVLHACQSCRRRRTYSEAVTSILQVRQTGCCQHFSQLVYEPWLRRWTGRKKGPGVGPRTVMKARIACTGQRGPSALPTMMSAPAPNWSHFDLFRWIRSIVGFSLSSTAISPHITVLAGSTCPADSGSSSPSLKNPKKAMVATAHRSSFSGRLEGHSCCPILLRTVAVIGRRV